MNPCLLLSFGSGRIFGPPARWRRLGQTMGQRFTKEFCSGRGERWNLCSIWGWIKMKPPGIGPQVLKSMFPKNQRSIWGTIFLDHHPFVGFRLPHGSLVRSVRLPHWLNIEHEVVLFIYMVINGNQLNGLERIHKTPVPALLGFEAPTVDGRNPAPSKPWNDDSPVHTNEPWFPMAFKVVRNGFRPVTVGRESTHASRRGRPRSACP